MIDSSKFPETLDDAPLSHDITLESDQEKPTIMPPPVPDQGIQEAMAERRTQKALAKIITRLDNEENLKNLHLKHYHMSTSQFRKRTPHLVLPKGFTKHSTE